MQDRASDNFDNVRLVVVPRRYALPQQGDQFFAHPDVSIGIRDGPDSPLASRIHATSQRTTGSIDRSTGEFSVAPRRGLASLR